MANYTLIQGNSSGIFEVTVDKVTDLTGYTCRIVVVKDDVVVLDKFINAQGSKFVGFITPAESELIPVGNTNLAIEVANDSIFYKKEISHTLNVRKQIVTS